MLFSVHAVFKPDIEAKRDEIHDQFNQHLMQRFMRILVAGPLRDEQGRRFGILLLIEANDFAQVQHFVATSPYTQAGLYDRVEINSLQVEVGRLE